MPSAPVITPLLSGLADVDTGIRPSRVVQHIHARKRILAIVHRDCNVKTASTDANCKSTRMLVCPRRQLFAIQADTKCLSGGRPSENKRLITLNVLTLTTD